MKKIISLSLILFTILMNSFSQTISPIQTTEQCPGVNVTFTVTIAAKSIQSVQPKALNVNPIVIQQPFNITISGTNITFSFIGKFTDNNNKQTFTVYYTDANDLGQTKDFTYPKIKSLLAANSFSQISPTPTSITAQRCQNQNFNISFTNVQYGNPSEAPPIGYGTVTNYEYQLPSGWKLNNGAPSTGTNWQAGNNSVTVTSDLATGDGGVIKIRPVNTACGTGLATGQEAVVSVSRPAPILSISNATPILCSGSATYTINGLPLGSTVLWTSNNNSDGTISNITSPTVTLSRSTTANTVVTLTATVTHCSFTYTRTTDVALGTGFNTVNYEMQQVTCVNKKAYYYANVQEVLGASNYAWYSKDMSNANNQFVLKTSGYGYNHIDFPLGLGNRYYTVYVLVTTPCGNIQSNLGEGYFFAPSCVGSQLRVSTTPNPAKNSVTIQLTDELGEIETDKQLNILEIQVTNKLGTILLTRKVGGELKSTSLDISSLKPNSYFIKVWDGTNWRITQLIKE